MPDTPWHGEERRQSVRLRTIIDDMQDRLAELEACVHELSMRTTLTWDTVAQLRRETERSPLAR